MESDFGGSPDDNANESIEKAFIVQQEKRISQRRNQNYLIVKQQVIKEMIEQLSSIRQDLVMST